MSNETRQQSDSSADHVSNANQSPSNSSSTTITLHDPTGEAVGDNQSWTASDPTVTLQGVIAFDLTWGNENTVEVEFTEDSTEEYTGTGLTVSKMETDG